jgi:hypothetical protein
MKAVVLVGLMLCLANTTVRGELTLRIVPESTSIGRYTGFCGVVEIANSGVSGVEFDCPTPASGTLGFEISRDARTTICLARAPLRATAKSAILGVGERLYVPFVVMVTDECGFVFGEPGQYLISAFSNEKVGGPHRSFDGSTPIAIDVYDWNMQDEWKVRAVGCAPLLAPKQANPRCT